MRSIATAALVVLLVAACSTPGPAADGTAASASQATDVAATSSPSAVASPSPAASSAPEQLGQVAPATAAVRIADFAFGPESVTVQAGGTVTWTNADSDRHSILLGGSESSRLESGATFSRSFATPGQFQYVCGLHSSMTGTIVVVAAGATAPGVPANVTGVPAAGSTSDRTSEPTTGPTADPTAGPTDAADDDDGDDDSDHSGPGGGGDDGDDGDDDDDHSGPGGGGDDDEDHSGPGGGSDDD